MIHFYLQRLFAGLARALHVPLAFLSFRLLLLFDRANLGRATGNAHKKKLTTL